MQSIAQNDIEQHKKMIQAAEDLKYISSNEEIKQVQILLAMYDEACLIGNRLIMVAIRHTIVLKNLLAQADYERFAEGNRQPTNERKAA